MRRGKVVAIGYLMALAAMETAEARTAAGECVIVQLQDSHLADITVLDIAKMTAAHIFEEIGVSLRWTISASRAVPKHCVAVQVRFRMGAPAGSDSNILAHAFPYADGGTQIHIFLERVLRNPSVQQDGAMLGYVITHEIGHVLEGVSRHSREGVMKPVFTKADTSGMLVRSLTFAPEDVYLIHVGLARKQEIAAAH